MISHLFVIARENKICTQCAVSRDTFRRARRGRPGGIIRSAGSGESVTLGGSILRTHRDTRDTPNDTPTPHIRHTFMIPIDIF